VRTATRVVARPPRNRRLVACACVVIGIVAVNAGIAIALTAGVRHEASAWPGPSFVFWPERSWQQVERRVQSLPAAARPERQSLGQVTYKEGSFPLYLLHFAAAKPAKRPLRVLLVSGMHGTESAGVEALLQVAEAIAREPSRWPQVTIDILPVINPWGWVYGYRYDGAGEDVNRDFASSRTQESRIVRDYLRRNGPFDLFMDLHESKKYGYFIYQYLPAQSGFGSLFVEMLKGMGKPPESWYREGMFQVRDGILHIPSAALAWIALARRLSLEQYARLSGTANAYTVETPLRDDFTDRVAVHRGTVEAFITRLVETAAGR
jgi:hypothetical protein